jgi:hypothetical protein
LRFIEAKHKTVTSGRNIRVQVIHDMEAPETGHTAEDIAQWWHGNGSPKTSAHYCYDNDSEVQCVTDMDVAYACPGLNHDGIHHELAGYAKQSPDEWRDRFSLATMTRCAVNVATKCEQYNNEKVWLSDKELAAGKTGIVDHWGGTRVYRKSTHTDAGPNFPKDLFIELVRAAPLLPQPDPIKVVLMNDCVDALVCPVDGGLQKLQRDGGVFNDHCDHFWGSYPGLGIDPGNPRQFNVMVRTKENGPTGYKLIATNGQDYNFPETA